MLLCIFSWFFWRCSCPRKELGRKYIYRINYTDAADAKTHERDTAHITFTFTELSSLDFFLSLYLFSRYKRGKISKKKRKKKTRSVKLDRSFYIIESAYLAGGHFFRRRGEIVKVGWRSEAYVRMCRESETSLSLFFRLLYTQPLCVFRDRVRDAGRLRW